MQRYPLAMTACVLTAVLFAISIAGCAAKPRVADPAPAVEPLALETAEAFIRAMLREDMDTVEALVARFDGVPGAAWDEEKNDRARIAEYVASGQGLLVPVEGHEIGDCAVVAVDERRGASPQRPRDIDPFYLVKQRGVWRVMPEPTSYDDWPVLTREQLAAFQQLEQWLDENKERLLEVSAQIDGERWLPAQ